MKPGSIPAPRIALVHDWLNQLGGAENVLEELAGLYPSAPIYTSIYAPQQMPDSYRQWTIHTSFMQHLPGVARRHQAYMPLYPLAFQRTDLSGYDLVISNKSGFCHGVCTARAGRKATHICYCLTPTRFLWLYAQYRAREQIHTGLHLALQPLLQLLRRWDWAAAQRVDHFIAISREVQRRIRTIYGRESTLIHPPVDTDFFTPASFDAGEGESRLPPGVQWGNYYLIVSRLIPYKRIDLAVAAMAQLPGEKLLIVGDGRDRAALQAQAGPNVTFLGRQSREEIRELLRGCKAFIFPGLEDFGIAPVEALATGRPVLAFAAGGALDTVAPGQTGELFAQQTPADLVDALRRLQAQPAEPAACRRQAELFSQAAFRCKLQDFVGDVLGERSKQSQARHPIP
jgi:glycosyltransferase involved in cell wall biosynthesis